MRNPFEAMTRAQVVGLVLGLLVLAAVAVWLFVGAAAWWPVSAIVGLVLVVLGRPRYVDEEPHGPSWSGAGPSI